MTVSVSIQGKDVNVTQQLREYVEKKVAKLDRYLPTIDEVGVELTEVLSARSAADRHIAQLTVHCPGVVLRTEVRKDDLFTAVDTAVEKMHRQIERYKGKHTRGRGDGAKADSLTAAPEPAEDLEDQEPVAQVVRRKRFTLTPMSETEAIDQMHLLGHDTFFVFYNAETSRINVLYRRRDSGFGLIDPDVG